MANATSPAFAREALLPGLQARVEAVLRQAGPGPRFGFVVATADGRELISILPDQRFIPASNTKMFTTAAAFAVLGGIDAPDSAGGTAVRLVANESSAADVIIEGRGDSRLSSAANCVIDCLVTLADAVAARTRVVRNIVGDDMLFPDERWSPGMSWNNIPTDSGTAISALTLDSNELAMLVTPTAPGQAPGIDFLPYYTVDNQAVTVAEGKTELTFDRIPGSAAGRLRGTILAGAPPKTLGLGIDDPAHYAAWRFRTMLEARGVRVKGDVMARHRPLSSADDPVLRKGVPVLRGPQAAPLARLTPPPLAPSFAHLNKVSQNVHAELLLRRLGNLRGTGSIADGVIVIRNMLERAGVRRADYDFSDGSGMSTYNRVAPRGMVVFLRWIAAQPWGAAWRST
ncbi:MAG TPA: D-alanyl-D-alanine carboxypeptidase/D-alanyl-D-alanine-endopeptidase, partial [Sphingomicrobium sp.]|nr:D-alanyl-D-alanine carboxypeptidase/D-alanyl-D-alanine-endopeptidase [Sphingomicrobium sp.]